MRKLILILWAICLPFLSEAQTCRDLLLKSQEYLRQSNNEQAKITAQKAYTQGKKEFARQSEGYITMLNTLIAIYNTMSMYEESEAFSIDRVNISKTLHGTNSEPYLLFVYQLGHTFQRERKYQAAAEKLEEARRLANAFFTQKYPDYIQFVNSLILLYRESGEVDKANKYCQEANTLCQKYAACREGQDHYTLEYNCTAVENTGSFMQAPAENYLEMWRTFKTNLLVTGPAPDSEDTLTAYGSQIEVIKYPSDGRMLQAFLRKGAATNANPKPAIVMLHGGNSAYSSLIKSCKAFTDAGFVVLVPAFRGENGNPGTFEMALGEVEDAKAAVKWLSQQGYVNNSHIYVFGHSYGGCIALALSLHTDTPIRLGGSCSGVFDIKTFEYLSERNKKEVPFDYSNEAECVMRCPVYFLNQMQRSHYLYMGTEDGFEENSKFINSMYPSKNTKLIIKEVKGDHFSSLEPSLNAFFEDILRLSPSLKPVAEEEAPIFPEEVEVAIPVGKVAWLNEFRKAPNIALTNNAYFRGREKLGGASGFLIQYNGVEYGISVKHLIEERGGGYKPSMKLSELNNICILWEMFPRTLSEKVVKMDKLLNTDDANTDDILIFSLAPNRDTSLYALPVRQSPKLPENVWLIGCPYTERNCQQNKYSLKVIDTEKGLVVARNLEPLGEAINGFSGAPIVDENGQVIGVLVGAREDDIVFFLPLKAALDKIIK